MNFRAQFNAAIIVVSSSAVGCCTWTFADDSETRHRLTLADLAAYRAALSGKPTAADATASDPPLRVNFQDLWSHPGAHQGRRVAIQGCVERIFRQGPVGNFPALAEVWITSPAGDPFCLVVPQDTRTDILPADDHGLHGRVARARLPALGLSVRFTGTFLMMVRYTAGDGARVAPLIVGDQPPTLAPEAAEAVGATLRASSHSINAGGHSGNPKRRWLLSYPNWLLGLFLTTLVAGVLAWQHLRLPSRRADAWGRARRTAAADPDPSLDFVVPPVTS
jgi:hypothetical protein